MNPIWREFIDLDAKLADLMDSKCISVLLDTVPHDPKTKKIDLNKACETLQVAFDSGVVLSKQEKDKRKAFLKTTSAVVESVFRTENEFNKAIAEIWLVENLLSVQKLLITAKFDAHCDDRLTGVGGEPNLGDLPRYIIILWCFCKEFAARSNEIHDKFFKEVFDFDSDSDDEENDVAVTDFLNVCPASQRAACVKATDSLIEKYYK